MMRATRRATQGRMERVRLSHHDVLRQIAASLLVALAASASAQAAAAADDQGAVTGEAQAVIRTAEATTRPGQLIHLRIATVPHVLPVRVCVSVEEDARIVSPGATGADDTRRYRCRTAPSQRSRVVRVVVRVLPTIFTSVAATRVQMSVLLTPQNGARSDASYSEVIVPRSSRPIQRLVRRLPQLAFTRPSGIWLTTAGSRQRDRQITSAAATEIAWEPDGKGMIFARTDGGLWRVSTDGSGLAKLTEPCSGDRWPAVSPDGRYLAFVRQIPAAVGCLDASPDDTSFCDPRECVRSARVMLLDRQSGELRELSSRGGGISDLAWDPRRPSVLYGLYKPDAIRAGFLFALDVGTSEPLPQRSLDRHLRDPVFESIGVSRSGDRIWAGTSFVHGTRLLRLPSLAQSYSFFSTIETSGRAAWSPGDHFVALPSRAEGRSEVVLASTRATSWALPLALLRDDQPSFTSSVAWRPR